MKIIATATRIILFLACLPATVLVAAPFSQKLRPDAGLIAAPHSLSNTLSEGTVIGDFEELHPGVFAGYGWASELREIGTNGLFEVGCAVFDQGRQL